MLVDEIGERNIDHPEALNRSADYIAGQWQAMGYEVRPQGFRARGVACRNLEVTRVGSTHPDTILLVGAHYDTARGGADANDSASGIAVLLEMARAVSGVSLECTLRFVAFANHMPPHYGTEKMGSWIYAHDARQRGDDIRAALILDSLGCHGDATAGQPPGQGGSVVAMVSNLRSSWLSRRFTQAFRHNSALPCRQISVPAILSGSTGGDQNPFWLHDYRAFVITDRSRYRSPVQRTERGTAETLDCGRITQVGEGVVKALLELERQYH